MLRVVLQHIGEEDPSSGMAAQAVSAVKESKLEPVFQLSRSLEDADLIILIHSNRFLKTIPHAKFLRGLPFYSGRCKVVAFSIEDYPAGFLPGLYSSLNSRNFDPRYHFCWPSVRAGNSSIRRAVDGRNRQDWRLSECRSFLFSFMGSSSDGLRRRLFTHFSNLPENDRWFVKEIDRWFDHSKVEEETYCDVIRKGTSKNPRFA